MRSITIDTQGSVLFNASDTVLVKLGRRILVRLLPEELDQVILAGNIGLMPGAIRLFVDFGVDVVFITIHGRFRGRLATKAGERNRLQRKQFLVFDDRERSLAFAKKYVVGKLVNFRILLRRYNKRYRDTRVSSSMAILRAATRKVEVATGFDSLRGYEGSATREYFSAFSRLVNNDYFKFTKRTRRPPRDPFNALLSFSYMMLVTTVRTRVNLVGLDPYLGSLHSVSYGRPSLVLDLMEEFRPVIVDNLVLNLVNKRMISMNDFYFQEDALYPVDDEEELSEVTEDEMPVRLTHGGIGIIRKQFKRRLETVALPSGEGEKQSYADIITGQVRLLATSLLDDSVEYQPFISS